MNQDLLFYFNNNNLYIIKMQNLSNTVIKVLNKEHGAKVIELPEETNSCMVHIIKNSEGKPIGWEMCPQTEEEHETVAIIRDLQFFGLEETYPSYNGLELIDPDKGKCTGNIKRISWLMRKYQNK